MIWRNATCYDGEWRMGAPHGEGEMRWRDGACYVGQWALGSRCGDGWHVDRHGVEYRGEWREGRPHGAGRQTREDGSWREGCWAAGELSGRAVEERRADDGAYWESSYEGELVLGSRHGLGTERRSDGSCYVGQWEGNVREGAGREESRGGWVYRGAWSGGMRHGAGVLTSPLGHRFKGQWESNALPHGEFFGKFVGRYRGDFRLSGDPEWPLLRHGRGAWTGRAGETYEGQWEDDRQQGMGVLRTEYTWYEGGFVRGKKHGHGELVRKDSSWCVPTAPAQPNGRHSARPARDGASAATGAGTLASLRTTPSAGRGSTWTPAAPTSAAGETGSGTAAASTAPPTA